MNKSLVGLALAAALVSGAAHAAIVDLGSFTSIGVVSASTELTNNAFITGSVVNALSFEWRHTYGDEAFAVATVILDDGVRQLHEAVGDPAGSTGWMTYVFSGGYTGNLVFENANANPSVDSFLSIRNLTLADAGPVSPVPEPETYAMLLAGLGVMGWVGRRRSQFRPGASNAAWRFTPPSPLRR